MKFLKKLIDSEYKELTKFEAIADSVLEMEGEMASLSDKELKAKTDEFKDLIKNGIDLDELIVPAFAVVREAAWRTIKQKPFNCRDENWGRKNISSNYASLFKCLNRKRCSYCNS